MPNILHSSETNEWYTPSFYIELVKKVMGFIDLDPASCEVANKFVGANRFFTKKEDGLNQSWEAENIFLNPPYGRNTEKWIKKLLLEETKLSFNEAIVLINAVPDRKYFQLLWNNPICFVYKRIKFIDENGVEQKDPVSPNAFIYLGTNIYLFRNVFSSIGHVVMPSAW